MSLERERITRSKANRKVVAAAKEWLLPLGFKSIGTSSECVFDRWRGDRFQSIVVNALSYNSVELEVIGRLGFVSAERVLIHFSEAPAAAVGVSPPLAFGLNLDYVQVTRDAFQTTIRWTYTDEEADLLQRLQNVVINFIYATMESVQTPDDLIDLQVAKIGDTDKFAIGRVDDTDGALRLLTLIRLYRPELYSTVRPKLQQALERWGPVDAATARHLAYIDQPGPLPPLPDPSAWKI